MAYDEPLAERTRLVLGEEPDVREKKMFGGLAFMKGDKMFCGIVKDDLMVRVGPLEHENALAEPGARPMDFGGRPMKGYVFVEPAGYLTDASLLRWISRGLEFVRSRPADVQPRRKRASAPRGRA